jgi:hypothetical protein
MKVSAVFASSAVTTAGEVAHPLAEDGDDQPGTERIHDATDVHAHDPVPVEGIENPRWENAGESVRRV